MSHGYETFNLLAKPDEAKKIVSDYLEYLGVDDATKNKSVPRIIEVFAERQKKLGDCIVVGYNTKVAMSKQKIPQKMIFSLTTEYNGKYLYEYSGWRIGNTELISRKDVSPDLTSALVVVKEAIIKKKLSLQKQIKKFDNFLIEVEDV